jgi:murein DD-endopeptidase MepM/ murein hydrolase activator NlpD
MQIKIPRYINWLPATLFLPALMLLASCKSGTINLFKPASPHEQYQRKLITAGLEKTAMGKSWIEAASQSLQKTLTIKIPYKETGYSAAEKVTAVAYQFTAKQGEKLNISLIKNPPDDFDIFVDLWSQTLNEAPKLISSADTLGTPLNVEINATGNYLIRLQPELLRSGQYTLEISSGPSLDFPVKTSKKSVSSFFGDGRDANSRKHEGIDIFAPLRTPVIAAAEGTVVRVNQNNLGGNVVWMRPKGKNFTLYYAHLDEQTATEGQSVVPGDTLGLMGNTGNARTTDPHLHFGIYTPKGAVDPLPFVNPVIKPLPKITASLENLNATMRTSSGIIVYVGAASAGSYRTELPDGRLDFTPSAQLSPASKPLRKLTLNAKQLALLNQPDSLAPVKARLSLGKSVSLLGTFDNFYLIKDENDTTGWVAK